MSGIRPEKAYTDTELGQKLQFARVQRKISLQQASKETNIPVHQLEALEEGNFSVFSAEVYARGAYARYATFLGIYSSASRRAAWRALSQARQHVPLRLHTPFPWFDRFVNPRTVIVAGALVLALAVGGYIAWQVRSFWQLPELTVSSPTSDIVREDSVVVRGISERQAHVRVNEETVLLQEDASFEKTIGLHPGINVLVVEAENAAGRVRTIERHILVPRT